MFPNDDGRIVPGLFARIRIPLSERHPALLVDERAIGTDQAQKFVLTLTPTNTVAYQPVQLGPLIDGKRVVRSGLQAGEEIVVNGLRTRSSGNAGDAGEGSCERVPTGQQTAQTLNPSVERSTPVSTDYELFPFLHPPPDFRRRAVHRRFSSWGCSRCSSCPSANIPRWCRPRSSCARRIPAQLPRPSPKPSPRRWNRPSTAWKIRSTCFRRRRADGVMTLTVTFKLGTDIDKAQVQVQNRVSQALPKLPEEVRRLGVTTTKQSPDLTMVVHLFSPERPLRRGLSAQLRDVAGEGRAGAHSRRRRRARSSAPAITRCASGSTRTKSPPAI